MITNFKNIFKKTKPSYIDSKYKQGFTLAEVLITLLIIGVVASLVIPALIAETEKAEIAVQVKKYQSILSQVTANIRNDYGSMLNSPLNSDLDDANGWNTFKQYLNLIKDCGTVSGETCWANGYTRCLNGNNFEKRNNNNNGKGILQDGSSIEYQAKTNCSMNRSITHSGSLHDSNCALIYIDVNGKKVPNQMGRDVFTWYLMKNGAVYPVGSFDDLYTGCDPTSQDVTPNSDGSPGHGSGCTAKVIKEGKIDY